MLGLVTEHRNKITFSHNLHMVSDCHVIGSFLARNWVKSPDAPTIGRHRSTDSDRVALEEEVEGIGQKLHSTTMLARPM